MDTLEHRAVIKFLCARRKISEGDLNVLGAAVFRCLEAKINIYFYYKSGVNGFKAAKNTATCFLVFIYDTIKKNVAKKKRMEIYKDIKKIESWKRSKLTVICKSCIIKH